MLQADPLKCKIDPASLHSLAKHDYLIDLMQALQMWTYKNICVSKTSLFFYIEIIWKF